MGGCSSLLMCIDLYVFAGNLRQIGSVKLWDEEHVKLWDEGLN